MNMAAKYAKKSVALGAVSEFSFVFVLMNDSLNPTQLNHLSLEKK